MLSVCYLREGRGWIWLSVFEVGLLLLSEGYCFFWKYFMVIVWLWVEFWVRYWGIWFRKFFFLSVLGGKWGMG